MSFVNGVCQKWYYDKFGAKRWAHDDSLFDQPNVKSEPRPGDGLTKQSKQ